VIGHGAQDEAPTGYLVDTSVLIAPPTSSMGDAPVFVSVVSIGELHAGVELARDPETRSVRMRRLTAVVSTIPTLPIDVATAARYGALRRTAGRGPSNDLWIAATAHARGLTLLTRDEPLSRVPGLRVELLA
jgi:predicted nucleic acid-binding protein